MTRRWPALRLLVAACCMGVCQARADEAPPAGGGGATAAGKVAPSVMRYYVLDAARQKLGTRGLTYINLIGPPDATQFLVYYEGDATRLSSRRGPWVMQVLLKQGDTVVGKVAVMDLGGRHGSVHINRHVLADCSVPMRAVDAVDAELER